MYRCARSAWCIRLNPFKHRQQQSSIFYVYPQQTSRPLANQRGFHAATTPAASTEGSPLRVSIVGSGPAAFYTAKYLLKDRPNIRIDIFERLPVPFGLVRFGVSPDHPEVKAVQHEFQRLLTDDRVQLYANITIGEHLHLSDLLKYYHAVVLAYGAQSERTLAIPGSQLQGIHPARVFVNWYNGHPEHNNHTDNFPLHTVKQVIVVGQGNVAIDSARMLLTPYTALQHTDIADHALQTLSASTVSSVYLLGRRGPVQAAFTTAELREISELKDIHIDMLAEEVALGEQGESSKELQQSRPKTRKMQLIKQILAQSTQQPVVSSKKIFGLRFFTAPVEYIEDPHKPGYVGAVKVEKMQLTGVAEALNAVGTGEYSVLPAQLVLESIGYRSVPIESSLPFDLQRRVIPSTRGRTSVPHVYVTGWLKRGPTGIIGSNIADAKETVQSLLADVQQSTTPLPTNMSSADSVLSVLHTRFPNHPVVDKVGWQRIESWENQQGQQQERPRIKIVHWKDMLHIAGV